MVPIIGFIVAVYAIARLLLVPIELRAHEKPAGAAWALSIIGVCLIGFLALALSMSGLPDTSGG